MEIDAAKARADLEAKVRKLEADLQLEREKNAAKIQMEAMKNVQPPTSYPGSIFWNSTSNASTSPADVY